MALIDNIKSHFSSHPMRDVTVPEWLDADGKPIVIYCTPMTLTEKQTAADVGEKEGYIARLAHILVMKACDAQGKKLFTIADKRALKNEADPDVIARVVKEIMAAITPEDAEKKS